ncbi:hypothetical protein G4177_18085 [Corallococcus sp. ZKHCc1 1396]|uniref:SelT/SelW/SelH family protein n=1 Tax=Corallococcus soli TaxID=2710757 RepID=A0ABR9PQ73_9BACT|nr:hypothetical protein [Corallococcus soli]
MESELKKGPSGSFEIAVNGRVVIRKTGLAFPTEQEVVDAVARAVGP